MEKKLEINETAFHYKELEEITLRPYMNVTHCLDKNRGLYDALGAS
jgi:hypothetical protein